MFRKILIYLTLPLLLIFISIPGSSVAESQKKNSDKETGTLKKLLAVSGSVAMDLDLNRLNEAGSAPKDSKLSTLRFEVAANSFFTVLVFNDALRGPELGSMGLVSQNSAKLPEALNASFPQLIIEKLPSEEAFDLVVRDGKTGFVFFNIEGHQYDYDAAASLLSIKDGRLLISEEFAKKLGRPSEARSIAGSISVTAMMSPIEITQVVNGGTTSAVMPAVGTVPGPDVIVGDLNGLAQFGSSSGTQVGLAVGTDSCNAGVVDLNWFANPNNDHPVIPQNLYRMSGGATNNERFEHIGQSNVKHAFTALTLNICGFGCNGVGQTHLGSGCSDPYTASLNSGQSGNSLGSRAWINPFTGVFPRNDAPTTNNSHSGHAHTGPSHRILVEINDLNTNLNAGATYYAEGQYITPHEYIWCRDHHGECNMYNNVSYRRYNVSGTTSFTFPASTFTTVRKEAAINAWRAADANVTINAFEPDPGNDGIAHIAYKVTNPSAGVWHYEYAVYNQNLDRAIQSFSVPLGCGISASNLGFHAPPQHPGWANDGTVGNAGYSFAPWASAVTANAVTWNSETFAQNQNANAIRWGTLYNFRFDSNRPPQDTNATIGFFKTGAPVTVAIRAPAPCAPLQLTGAVSRKIHDSAGPFDIPLPLTGNPGIECRTGGVTQVVFTFGQAVTFTGADVTSGTGDVATTSGNGTNQPTVNLTGVTDDQTITVTLFGVSGGGSPVDISVPIGVLLGDVNASRMVTSGDVTLCKTQNLQTVTGPPSGPAPGNFRNDVNAGGTITSGDATVIKQNNLTSLDD